MVLFVSESTSIARQLGRGREIAEHNRKVAETGIGAPIELRATDMSEELVRRRYQVFKEQTWTALTSLRQLYHYHFVNAEGPISEVQANILKELKYQSSLELDPRTFRAAARRCRSPKSSSCTAGRSWSSGSTATSWNTPSF